MTEAARELTRDNEGVQVVQATACILCGREGTLLYSGLRDRLFDAPGSWSLRVCRGCGLAWLDPRPLPREVGKLYVQYYTHEPVHRVGRPFLEGLRRSVKVSVLRSRMGYIAEAETRASQRALGVVAAVLPPVHDAVELSVMCLPGNKKRKAAGRGMRKRSVPCHHA